MADKKLIDTLLTRIKDMLISKLRLPMWPVNLVIQNGTLTGTLKSTQEEV